MAEASGSTTLQMTNFPAAWTAPATIDTLPTRINSLLSRFGDLAAPPCISRSGDNDAVIALASFVDAENAKRAAELLHGVDMRLPAEKQGGQPPKESERFSAQLVAMESSQMQYTNGGFPHVSSELVFFIDELVCAPQMRKHLGRDGGRELFLRNLPGEDAGWSAEDLCAWIEGYGSVDFFKFFDDSLPGRPPGCGYVRFAEHETARSLLEALAAMSEGSEAQDESPVALWSLSELLLHEARRDIVRTIGLNLSSLTPQIAGCKAITLVDADPDAGSGLLHVVVKMQGRQAMISAEVVCSKLSELVASLTISSDRASAKPSSPSAAVPPWRVKSQRDTPVAETDRPAKPEGDARVAEKDGPAPVATTDRESESNTTATVSPQAGVGEKQNVAGAAAARAAALKKMLEEKAKTAKAQAEESKKRAEEEDKRKREAQMNAEEKARAEEAARAWREEEEAEREYQALRRLKETFARSDGDVEVVEAVESEHVAEGSTTATGDDAKGDDTEAESDDYDPFATGDGENVAEKQEAEYDPFATAVASSKQETDYDPFADTESEGMDKEESLQTLIDLLNSVEESKSEEDAADVKKDEPEPVHHAPVEEEVKVKEPEPKKPRVDVQYVFNKQKQRWEPVRAPNNQAQEQAAKAAHQARQEEMAKLIRARNAAAAAQAQAKAEAEAKAATQQRSPFDIPPGANASAKGRNRNDSGYHYHHQKQDQRAQQRQVVDRAAEEERQKVEEQRRKMSLVARCATEAKADVAKDSKLQYHQALSVRLVLSFVDKPKEILSTLTLAGLPLGDNDRGTVRSLMRLCHPDKCPHPDAKKAMHVLNPLFKALS